MIPHVHDDEGQRGVRVLSPLEGRRTPTPLPWWRAKNLPQRAASVLVLFAVGLAAPTAIAPLGAGFFAVLGAAWLDSWWACLVVPVALAVGSLVRQLTGAGFELTNTALLVVSALLGAALGTAFFNREELWSRVRSKRP